MAPGHVPSRSPGKLSWAWGGGDWLIVHMLPLPLPCSDWNLPGDLVAQAQWRMSLSLGVPRAPAVVVIVVPHQDTAGCLLH